MRISKRIISFIVLLCILTSSFHTSYATQPNTQKLLIDAKNELSEVKKGDSYIKAIDTLIEKLKNNEEKLLTLSEKIIKIKWNLNSESHSTINKLIYYIELKIDYALIQLIADEEDIENNITEEENKKINEKLIQIQLNLLEKWTSHIQSLISDFKKIAQYEEKGNLEMNLAINQNQIGNLKAHFWLSDYRVKNSIFDAQVTWTIDSIIEASPNEWDDIKLQLNTLIDFISKDGNMYLLFKELDIIDNQWLEKIKDSIQKLEEIAKQNKYIHFEDEQTQKWIQILKNINPNKILSDGKTILSRPMFQAYKKVDNKFYLIPTKYACDRVKEFLNTFDPFHGKECSEGQYNDLLDTLEEAGSIYIELWTDTKLGFEWIKTFSIQTIEWHIVFSDKEIKEVNIEIIPNQDIFKDEWFTLEYKKSEKLNFSLFAEKWDIDFKLWSILDSNNRFHVINFSWVSKSDNISLSSNLQLNNKKITWNILYTDKKYNSTYEEGIYTGGQQIDNNKVEINIAGNTNAQNTLSDIEIDITWTDIETDTIFETANFSYNSGVFTLKNNYISESLKSYLDLSATWNSENKNFTQWDFDISIDKKEWKYDYETYEFKYIWDYKNIFKSEVLLKDKNITGSTMAQNIKEESIFSIDHSWKYEKNYLDWNNSFEINNIPQVFLWSENTQTDNTVKGNFNLEIDMRDNKDNANIYFDANLNNKQIIKFEIDNKATIEYREVEVIY